MSLTIAHGPLVELPPETVNYRFNHPEHRLFFDAFPRRVRAALTGRAVFDTIHGLLLHETVDSWAAPDSAAHPPL